MGGGTATHESASSDSVSIGGGSCVRETAGLVCRARLRAIVAACLRVRELCRWNPLAGGLGLASSSLRTSTSGSTGLGNGGGGAALVGFTSGGLRAIS